LIRNHAAIIASAKLEKFPEVRGPRNGGGGGGGGVVPGKHLQVGGIAPLPSTLHHTGQKIEIETLL